MLKKCIICGREFETTRSQRKLCSKECQHLRSNERARATKARIMQDPERRARKNQLEREWYAKNKDKCRRRQQDYYRRHAKERLKCRRPSQQVPEKEIRTVKCVVCGQNFETRDGRRKICSESCRLIQKRKWQRKYSETHRQEELLRKRCYENKHKGEAKKRQRERRRDKFLENRLATVGDEHGLEFWHDLKKINLDEEYWGKLKKANQ